MDEFEYATQTPEEQKRIIFILNILKICLIIYGCYILYMLYREQFGSVLQLIGIPILIVGAVYVSAFFNS